MRFSFGRIETESTVKYLIKSLFIVRVPVGTGASTQIETTSTKLSFESKRGIGIRRT